MSPAPHISPKVRAYGKARIDITRRAQDEDEWRRLWKEPSQPYPFAAGEGWKFNLVYTVEDYAAEIGFFIDVLGFPVLAFSPSRVQLTSPDSGFALTILAVRGDGPSTPPDALRLQVNVEALSQTVRELERRGVAFDQQPAPVQAGSSWQMASFRTPHGVSFDLLSEATVEKTPLGLEQEVERQWIDQARNEDQARQDDLVSVDAQTELEREDEPAGDQIDEKPEASPASESQPSLWPRFPAGSDRQKSAVGNPVGSGKPGNGNLELTYDPLDDDSAAGDDIEEDFP